MPNEIVPHDEDVLLQESGSIIPADDETIKVLRLSHLTKGQISKTCWLQRFKCSTLQIL